MPTFNILVDLSAKLHIISMTFVCIAYDSETPLFSYLQAHGFILGEIYVFKQNNNIYF